VLRRHARHVDTGEPVPEALLAKLKASKDFGAGFAATEYTACALLDQELHALPAAALEELDVGAFEAAALGRLQMPQGMALRHRPAHFSHLFSGEGCKFRTRLDPRPRSRPKNAPRIKHLNTQPLLHLDPDAAAYYCYLWAEVLDADAFEAFKEAAGGVFDPAVAQRVLESVYAQGNTVEPGEAFRRFRGRDPVIGPMLKKKGLLVT
jgi:peptidyl-dipeptidase Dcp